MRDNTSDIVKCFVHQTIVLRIAFFLGCCLLPLAGFGQTGGEAVDVLVEMGFENVGCTENSDERIYVLENAAYRSYGVGIGKAVDVIQKMGLPDQKTCRIIVLNNNVPQISLYYHPVKADTAAVVTRWDWNVSYDVDKAWKQAGKIKTKNSSLFKVDIVVYPDFSFQNLLITQIYQVLFNLSPAVEVSLWKGMKLTGQVIFPVYNEYGTRYKQIREGYITLSQTVRLPYNTFLKGVVGTFNNSRWGVDFSAKHYFVKDNRFSVEARVGYTGHSRFENFAWHVSPLKRWTWAVGGNFYWPKFNTLFSLKVEQYLLKEKGVRFDMMRMFRYANIGFYAMKVEHAPKNGGFYVQILLPPYGKYKRKQVRITPARYFGLLYNSGNERYYGKSYVSELGTVYGYENSFNPYFVKSELLNY